MLCSNYIFLLDSVLVGYLFSEICPLLGCPVCWHLVVHSILLQFFLFLFFFLCISVVLNVISLKFLVLLIWVLSLFFLVSWPEVCWVCLPFQKSRDFGFIDFSISLLFISSLILIIFFFLLTWDCCCCCSFSSSVRW